MVPEISLVIPVLNESESINVLFETLIKEYTLFPKFEVILVDDGSTDNTLQKIKNFKDLPFSCKVLTLSKNYGSHAAVRAGFQHCTGKNAVYFPSDLQISLSEIIKLYQFTLSGKEVVYGTRKIISIGLVEKIFSRSYSYLMRKFVYPNFPKEGIETVLISRKVLDIFNQNVEANSSFVLQIISLGFNNQFVSIEKTERKTSKSKWNLSMKVKLLVDSFIAFSYAPIRFVTLVGILLFIAGLLWTAYIVFRKLVYNDLESGWPALVSILTIGFGITNISLGIMAEYLWRTLDSSRKRPVFIINEIIEIKNNATN